MSAQMKGGKLPLSAKKQSNSFKAQFGNRLRVDEELHAEITGKGMEYRWLDAKKLYNNQGYHANGWTAYTRPATAGGTDFKNGNDPDGIVRRGSMILGVRSKELSESHREHLKDKSIAQVGRDRNASQRSAAAELRKMAGNTGIKIVEGDDDADDDFDAE